jgi:hypothetical protein
MLERYLGLTKEEIQMNEALLKEEKGIVDASNVSDVRIIYDEDAPKPESAEETEDIAPEGGEQFPVEEPPAEEEPTDEPTDEEPPAEDEGGAPDLGTLEN